MSSHWVDSDDISRIDSYNTYWLDDDDVNWKDWVDVRFSNSADAVWLDSYGGVVTPTGDAELAASMFLLY